MLKSTLSALLLCVPAFAIGVPLDQGLRCEMGTVEFFRPLVQYQFIYPKAIAVRGAINFFAPHKRLSKKNGETLEAFGMPVESVFGYAAGQIMFTTEDPRIMSPDLFGVVVREEIGNVQAQLRAMNVTKATTRRVTHNTTEISCIGV